MLRAKFSRWCVKCIVGWFYKIFYLSVVSLFTTSACGHCQDWPKSDKIFTSKEHMATITIASATHIHVWLSSRNKCFLNLYFRSVFLHSGFHSNRNKETRRKHFAFLAQYFRDACLHSYGFCSVTT